MNKKLIPLLTLLLMSLITLGCKNYYYLKHTPPKVDKDEGRAIHHLKFSNENMQLVTYGDYQINTVNKKYIFFTTKNIDQILISNFKKKFSEQFLFMYTNMSVYNNLLGFYYAGSSLDEVMKSYDKKPDIDLTNGILYTYDSGAFDVVDIYKKCDGGVIRFINLNNPDENDPQNKKFHREVNKVFFELNADLWDKSTVDFQ
ncbi:hypothetical protein [Chryseobacterium aurantiacum]|uniref:hypothetical protein n=1 Tax=Chryseobacterium aurantiacum TaxID=2116499 RepID=UPI0013C535C4|nr:hypothetical protein [Chryseobacterium aurantiacum]